VVEKQLSDDNTHTLADQPQHIARENWIAFFYELFEVRETILTINIQRASYSSDLPPQ
jgi:hypothetical protein